ncbi:hypothetical protein ISS07_02680 [Candidatus Woesearchaeota archaeon]|nr:hypothetical protein [Candidatus Woesearchaeota archaeon]
MLLLKLRVGWSIIKIIFFLICFLLLGFGVFAGWEQFQNGDFNQGDVSGVGYFSGGDVVNFSVSFGSDHQPLISDVDSSGEKEIIIFDNKRLKLFNAFLELINETFVGDLLGQGTIFSMDEDSYDEIIFNANVSGVSYFFAYEFNGTALNQELNFTISNGAIGSGVKCFSSGTTKTCVFMDNSQYIHIVNLSSKTEEIFNTSVFNDTHEKIPALGDIDLDGQLEAVWWHDADDDTRYGFLVFDLVSKSLDVNFSGDGIVDDVYNSINNGFVLKGHPVLVDLNQDGKLEIAASVLYNDATQLEMWTDWFMELFVYDNEGNKLFSKCEDNTVSDVGCNDGTSESVRHEGPNPFVLDSDSDGFDEVCFMKDKKKYGHIKNMTMSCYNYSGGLVLESNLNTFTDTIRTATTADMNNDGLIDIITENNIYALNGSSIFSHGFGSNYVIPIDIDGNSALDLVASKSGETIIFLDNKNYSVDFSIKEENILFHVNNVEVKITNNKDGFAKNVEVVAWNTNNFINQSKILDVRGNSNVTVSFNLSFDEKDIILVQTDYGNKINETDEKNNFAFRKFENFPLVYVDVNLELDSLEEEFTDYVKNNLKSGYFTSNENEASVKVYIGKKNLFNKQKSLFTKNNYDYYYDFGNVYYLDSVGSYPYNGIIGSYKENGIINVLIYGNGVDGDIAALKEFIDKEDEFVNSENSFFISNSNSIGVRVFDYLHHTGNSENYLVDNTAFKQIVRNALKDEMFVEKDYSVNSDLGVSLRLRNLKPNSSPMYLSYLNDTGVPISLPVVMAHGLFSNLSSWQELGSEISNSGRDAWLIEITGGPGQDCSNCPDYTFDDLISDYFPSLLNKVISETSAEKIQYVGFSNGCRTALSSLENNYFDSDKIETFIGVGCPGAFEGESVTKTILKLKGKPSENINTNHVSLKKIIQTGVLNKNYFSSEIEGKISSNLLKFYEDLIINENDSQPGNFNLTRFLIFQGNALISSDGVVTVEDESQIYQNINLNGSLKKHFNILSTHLGMENKERTKSIIQKELNKEKLSFFEENINLINKSGD